MADLVIKVCVLGPSGVGKTSLCKVLSDQLQGACSTVPVRIQELGRQMGSEHVKVQLWDVAGGAAAQQYWEVLAKNVDGVLLTIDPNHMEQERELEQLYLNFAQPNSLAMKQCMVLGLTVNNAASTGSWAGLRGKLKKLPMGQVAVNPASPASGLQAASDILDRLLAGCVAQKKDRLEKAVLGE